MGKQKNNIVCEKIFKKHISGTTGETMQKKNCNLYSKKYTNKDAIQSSDGFKGHTIYLTCHGVFL